MSESSSGTVVVEKAHVVSLQGKIRRGPLAAAAPTSIQRASARARAQRLHRAICLMHPHKASTVTLGISTKDGTVRAAFSDQAILHAIRQALRMCMEEAEYQGGVHETQIMQRRQEEEAARKTA